MIRKFSTTRRARTFAFVLLSLFTTIVLLTLTAARANAQPLSGRWEGVIHYDSVAITFPLSWYAPRSTPDALTLSLFNGVDSISSTGVRKVGDSVIVEFAHLASQLRGVVRAGEFTGYFGNTNRRDSTLVTAHAASTIRAKKIAGVPNISGTWIIPHKTAKGEGSWRFVVQQSDTGVIATILRVDGDAGAMAGKYLDGAFRLAHFDGTRPSLLNITVAPNGSLQLKSRGPRGAAIQYSALRPDVALAQGIAEPANFATHTTVKDLREPLRFSGVDTAGNSFDNTDKRFAGKVVVVNVTGSWCPNCHDEAPYLSSLYQKYRDKGVEIVALDFEEPDQLPELKRLKAFIKRYNIAYTYLLAGETRQVLDKLPQAVNLNTWPATFFLGRDGTVRAVRTGFAARASGAFHDTLEDDYENIIKSLVKESGVTSGGALPKSSLVAWPQRP